MIPYANVLAIPLQLALAGVVATLAHGKTKALAVALAFLGFVPPFLPDRDQHLVRFIAALGTVLVVFRSLDLATDPKAWPLLQRLWLHFAIFDSRAASRRPAAFDGRAWAKTGGFALLVAIGAGGVYLIGEPRSPAAWAGRWLCGACFVYACVDMAESLVRASYQLAGFHVPRFHHHPVVSQSLEEFWGRRWNMIVQALLSRHVFRPLVRRRLGRAAVAAVFVASALLHFWLIAASHEMFWACTTAAFFAIQGVGMLLERPLGVARWRQAPRHIWTVAWVALPAPLMFEPLLQIFGL